jgi:hypothetical protein
VKSGGLRKDDIGRGNIALHVISLLGVDPVQLSKVKTKHWVRHQCSACYSLIGVDQIKRAKGKKLFRRGNIALHAISLTVCKTIDPFQEGQNRFFVKRYIAQTNDQQRLQRTGNQ